MNEMCQDLCPNAHKILVGNKRDLEAMRLVSTEIGQTLADHIGCIKFLETSVWCNVQEVRDIYTYIGEVAVGRHHVWLPKATDIGRTVLI